MSKIRTALAIAMLATVVAVVPAFAQDEAPGSVVGGTIVLPEDAAFPPDSTIIVTVDDTSVADAPADTLSRLVMDAPAAESPVPFALSVLPDALAEHPATEMNQVTLGVRVESADGTLLFVNDTAIAAVDPSGPVTDLVVPLVAADGS